MDYVYMVIGWGFLAFYWLVLLLIGGTALWWLFTGKMKINIRSVGFGAAAIGAFVAGLYVAETITTLSGDGSASISSSRAQFSAILAGVLGFVAAVGITLFKEKVDDQDKYHIGPKASED